MSWSPTTRQFTLYPHPSKENGKSISFIRRGNNPLGTEYLGHEFVDRSDGIKNKYLKAALPLDQVIHIPSYEEVLEIYKG